jgi:hypothetical protein
MPQPDPAKAVKLLDSLLQFFGEHGEHWTRFTLDDGKGNRCLLGAIEYVHCKHRSTASGIADYIAAAIWPPRERGYSPARLATFNDRCKDFESIRAVIAEARALAQRDAERWPELIAAAKAAAAEKEEAAAAHKRQLLAELERERMIRHAAGDTRATYILCPRAPEPRTPERLAA